MSEVLLRRTIRRCTALLLIVLGAVAVELASLEYPDGGTLIGASAIAGGVLYLACSALAGIADGRDEPDLDAGDDASEPEGRRTAESDD